MSLANIINKTYCICGGKLKKKIILENCQQLMILKKEKVLSILQF